MMALYPDRARSGYTDKTLSARQEHCPNETELAEWREWQADCGALPDAVEKQSIGGGAPIFCAEKL